MFTKKFFFTFAILASIFSDSTLAKKSHSRRHPKSIVAEVTTPEILGERSIGPDGIEVFDVDLRALGIEETGGEMEIDLEKRSGVSVKSVSVPSNVKGTHTGIGSWFRADNAQDSTNGRSWCGFAYHNSDPGFAMSLNLMGGGSALWGRNTKLWNKSTNTYCGLQAELTYKGKTYTGYMLDAFDPAWVRTKFSIDILINLFEKLWGKNTSNKNDVMNTVKWRFTGKKATKWTTHN